MGARLLYVALLLVAAAAACSLNPQPLPPGANFKGEDAGDFGPPQGEHDGAPLPNGTTTADAAAPPPPAPEKDAGGLAPKDASPADASSDAPLDAAADAASDAATDTSGDTATGD